MKYVWPVITTILLIVLVGVVAFFLGKQTATAPTTQNITPTNSNSKAINQNPTITNQVNKPAQVTQKTISAGGVLSFPNYILIIPDDWVSQREQGLDSDKLTLTKQNYKITISEGAFGGSGCVYPGDPPQEMAQSFTSYIEIINPNGYVFRRSSTGSGSGWSVCQKGSEGSFGGPTIFGHVSITAPSNPDATIVAEIDAILTSLNKK